MPDNPNPDRPHEHLYWRHHRELARDTAALPTAPPAIVIHCVICGAGTTFEPDPPTPLTSRAVDRP